jgi:hypothetical protein
VKRLPVSPLVLRALEISEKRLGIGGLCSRLGATPSTIQAWRLGDAEMSDREFLKLVDLLTELDPAWMSPTPKR